MAGKNNLHGRKNHPFKLMPEENGVYCLFTDTMMILNKSLMYQHVYDMVDMLADKNIIIKFFTKRPVLLGCKLMHVETSNTVHNMSMRIRQRQDFAMRYFIHVKYCPRCLELVTNKNINYYVTYGLNLNFESQEDQPMIDKLVEEFIYQNTQYAVVKIDTTDEICLINTTHTERVSLFRSFWKDYEKYKNTVQLPRNIGVFRYKYDGYNINIDGVKKSLSICIDKVLEKPDEIKNMASASLNRPKHVFIAKFRRKRKRNDKEISNDNEITKIPLIKLDNDDDDDDDEVLVYDLSDDEDGTMSSEAETVIVDHQQNKKFLAM